MVPGEEFSNVKAQMTTLRGKLLRIKHAKYGSKPFVSRLFENASDAIKFYWAERGAITDNNH